MIERIIYRAVGANIYHQDGTLACIAVDPLDAEVIAGALQWKVAIHEPESTPEPDPYPTAPLIVDAEGQVWFKNPATGWYYDAGDTDMRNPDEPFTGPVAPVTVVAQAEWEALVEVTRAWNTTFGVDLRAVARAATDAVTATDALGVTP